MATNTHLPVISNASTTDGKAEDTDKTASFLSRLQLGSLQRIALPGDVYYPQQHAKQSRPLGLIPNRNDRLAALKKLNQLFTPALSGFSGRPQLHRLPLGGTISQSQTESETSGKPAAGGTISATVKTLSRNEAESKWPRIAATSTLDPYKLPHKNLSEQDGDPDYMPIGEKASEYYAGASPRASVLGVMRHPQTFAASAIDQKQDRKKATLKR